MTMPCPQCGLPSTSAVQQVAGAAGDTTVEFGPVTAWRCEAGHEGRAPSTIEVVGGIEQQLTVAGRRRLRRADQCGACEAMLTMPGRRTETPVPLSIADGVVTVHITTEMVRCPDCGQEQLPSAGWVAVQQAVDVAIGSAQPRRQ